MTPTPHSENHSTEGIRTENNRREYWDIGCRRLKFPDRSLVMGILNVTPDSFSDGGRHNRIDDAVRAALEMQMHGADIIDIGGESTRPYADPIAIDEELSRVIPVIERISKSLSIPISIDTSKSEVARQAVAAGAEIINDITGLLGDPVMGQVAAESGVGVCVMHIQGTPQTMQDNPVYDDVVTDVERYLVERREACERMGIQRDRICLDPGIGFGKTHEQNLELLRATNRFVTLGSPILIGHSRKGFIAKLIGSKESDRTAGTIGVSLAVAAAGAQILRVHDVKPTVDALRLFEACGGIKA